MNFSLPGLLADFTIPDIGVDTAGAVTAAITALAAVVVVAVGGYAAFLIVRRGLRWLGTALR